MKPNIKLKLLLNFNRKILALRTENTKRSTDNFNILSVRHDLYNFLEI